MDFVCVCISAKCQNPFLIAFQNQVHCPFFSGPWYKRLGKGKTAEKNLYFEDFHFFSDQIMVQWSKAGLIILPVWFESWKLLSFAKIQKVYDSWKVFVFADGRMDGCSDFFHFLTVSCPFTSWSILPWVRFPIEALIYFLFHLKWSNMKSSVIIMSYLYFSLMNVQRATQFIQTVLFYSWLSVQFSWLREIQVSEWICSKSIQLLVWSGPIHMKSIQTHDANHFYFMIWHENRCVTFTKLIPRWVDWCHKYLLILLTQLSVVCSSLWCVGTCRLTFIDCHTSLLYALDAVSRLCMCVSYNVDIYVLWFWRCVNVCVLCVVCWFKQSLSIQPLCTHKNTSQSLCNIYFHDRSIFTFHTSHYIACTWLGSCLNIQSRRDCHLSTATLNCLCEIHKPCLKQLERDQRVAHVVGQQPLFEQHTHLLSLFLV